MEVYEIGALKQIIMINDISRLSRSPLSGPSPAFQLAFKGNSRANAPAKLQAKFSFREISFATLAMDIPLK
jgi:hypothetical protein